MPSKCNIDKIKKEIDKCEHPNELVATYSLIKTYIADKLDTAKLEARIVADAIEDEIRKINGN